MRAPEQPRGVAECDGAAVGVDADRENAHRGLATLCVGVGPGVSLLVERV